METTALKVLITIFIVINFHLSTNGDNIRDHTRKIRSLESFIYSKFSGLQNVPDNDSLTTLSNNIKHYLGFPLAILKKTGQDIVNEVSKIFRDTFADVDEDDMNNFISTTLKNKL